MEARGRKVAVGVVIIGLLTLAGAGFAFKDKAVEQWYLLKLDSEEEEERELAAEKLGEIGSKRAIPQLIEIFRRSPKPTHRGAIRSVAFSPNGKLVVTALGDRTVRIWDAATGYFISGADIRSHYSARALVKIGRPAVPALMRVLKDNDEGNQLGAVEALGEIGPQARDAVPALTLVLEDKNEFVRQAAAKALRKIQSIDSGGPLMPDRTGETDLMFPWGQPPGEFEKDRTFK